MTQFRAFSDNGAMNDGGWLIPSWQLWFSASLFSMPGRIPLDSLAVIVWNPPLQKHIALAYSTIRHLYRVSTGQVPGKSPGKERDG